MHTPWRLSVHDLPLNRSYRGVCLFSSLSLDVPKTRELRRPPVQRFQRSNQSSQRLPRSGSASSATGWLARELLSGSKSKSPLHCSLSIGRLITFDWECTKYIRISNSMTISFLAIIIAIFSRTCPGSPLKKEKHMEDVDADWIASQSSNFIMKFSNLVRSRQNKNMGPRRHQVEKVFFRVYSAWLRPEFVLMFAVTSSLISCLCLELG